MSVHKSDDLSRTLSGSLSGMRSTQLGDCGTYLDAVEATCRLLGQHPRLGPRGGFKASATSRLAVSRRVQAIQQTRPLLRSRQQ